MGAKVAIREATVLVALYRRMREEVWNRWPVLVGSPRVADAAMQSCKR
jgi:hypothetical protein